MEYIFMLSGPFLIIVGIIILSKRRKFAKESVVINGEVIEIIARPARRNQTAYYPVVKYFDQSTSSEEVFESNNPYEPSKYKIGDQVELRYLNDSGNKKICLNNWFGVWGLPFMLILFGFIFSAINLVLFLFRP